MFENDADQGEGQSTDLDNQPDGQELSLSEIAGDLDDGGEELLDAGEGNPEGSDENGEGTDPNAKPTEDAWKDRKAKVTVNGQEVEITVGEALHGYMRQADYQRKTQDLSAQQSQVQAIRTHIEQELANRANQLQVLSGALYQELVGDQNALAQLADDPAAYIRKQQEMGRKAALLTQVQQQQEGLRQQAANDQAKAQEERTREANTVLSTAIPEWADPAKRVEIQKDIRTMLTKLGYQPQELAQLSDHRAMLVAYKAALWDKHQALAANKTRQQPRTPVKPGAGGQPNNANLTRAQERFRRNPQSVDALADFALARGGI